ncbi:MAG: helix-turn-helix transcriptional regulator, partial [Novosphingobium sp.]
MSVPVRFSTQVVPPQQRRLFWRDVVAEAFPGMTADAPNEIRADLSRWTLGPIGLAQACSSRARVSRVANQDGHTLVLHLGRRGHVTLEYGQTVVTVGLGSIVITDDSRPYAFEISDANDCLIFQVPVSHLGETFDQRDWHGTLLRAGDPNVSLFTYMVQGLWGQREQFGDVDGTIGDVLAEAAKVACRSGAQGAKDQETGLSPVNFALRHIDNPELGTATICKATGLSPRGVQKAFLRHSGLTPTAYINERRLTRAAELLSGSDRRSITDVAFDVGFQDPAFFSQ